jgi:hypothetical protein
LGYLGIPDLIPNLPIDYWINQPFRFHDTKLSASIRHAIHVAAVDEQQKVLQLTPMELPVDSTTRLVQRWFPGDHGLVAKLPNGGGNGLADLTLGWMIEQVGEFELGLEFDRAAVAQLRPDALDQTIVDLFAERQREPWRLNFLTLPGLKTREVVGPPSRENQVKQFHPAVQVRWREAGRSYRPRCLIEQGWEAVFDAG